MIFGIDTASPISANAARSLKAMGYSFVGRYLVPEEGNLKWKALTAAEAKILRSEGLSILLVWETLGNRARGGARAGSEDGISAARRAAELGIPDGTVICFAVDYDAPRSDYASIEAYLRSAKWNIGNYKLGLYAPAAVLNQMESIIDFGWQCYAWSYGAKADVAAYQTAWQGDVAAKALEKQLGFAVDLDEAKSLDGMWRVSTPEDDALKWAKSHGIVTDDADSKIALALWRYHCTFTNADDKKDSGLLA